MTDKQILNLAHKYLEQVFRPPSTSGGFVDFEATEEQVITFARAIEKLVKNDD